MSKTSPAEQTYDDDTKTIDSKVIASLLENRKNFLVFLKKRTGSEQQAEEILQEAFLKTVEKGSELRDKESAIAWFYRLLRNALIDSYRRQSSKEKALVLKVAEDSLLNGGKDSELENAICECMKILLPTLKDEYADVLNKVDLQEKSIAEVARESGVTTNNANVRLHRARLALKKQLERSCGACATHGCLDCSCKNKTGSAHL